MAPYGIISDTHHHAWSAFAKTNPGGVNSRLQIILDETLRAAKEVKAAGGNILFHAGDMFHVRGRITPSVQNPTLDMYNFITATIGINIVILAGNHDLETEESNRLGSAITALDAVHGVRVINEVMQGYGVHDNVLLVPWIKDVEKLKAAIERIDPLDRLGVDLIIHAPVDGVIAGIPSHGLDDAYLAGLEYRRVFCGHYHHHKDFGNGVYSIGALAHHTWSDVGSKAGFLIVTDKEVKWHASHAPSFVEITAETPIEEIPLIVDGNYVKAKIGSSKASDVEEMRQFLTKDCQAAGVVIFSQREGSVSERSTTAVSASTTLETSVSSFVDAGTYTFKSDLQKVCQEILAEVRAAK